MEFLYEKEFEELAVDLQDRIESCLPDETGYKCSTFVCPHCGSFSLFHSYTDEYGNFIYTCFDCMDSFHGDELELI